MREILKTLSEFSKAMEKYEVAEVFRNWEYISAGQIKDKKGKVGKVVMCVISLTAVHVPKEKELSHLTRHFTFNQVKAEANCFTAEDEIAFKQEIDKEIESNPNDEIIKYIQEHNRRVLIIDGMVML